VKLRAEKGINLPDSPLPIAALTDEDRTNLGFVADHADLVGLSFVRGPADVTALHEALGQRTIGIVLKIETRAGFENLPRILLEAMRRPPVAAGSCTSRPGRSYASRARARTDAAAPS
jgi:pyruvate kinase